MLTTLRESTGRRILPTRLFRSISIRHTIGIDSFRNIVSKRGANETVDGYKLQELRGRYSHPEHGRWDEPQLEHRPKTRRPRQSLMRSRSSSARAAASACRAGYCSQEALRQARLHPAGAAIW